MIVLRSLVFNILFYLYTALMTLLAMGGHILGRRYALKIAYGWGIGTHLLLKWVVGLTFEIRGRHHWDGEPSIFACKHQSLLETTMIQVLAFDSFIILKRELLWIPFFGQALSALKAVGIKRSRGHQALKELVEKAAPCLAAGHNFMIFPEGTRTAPSCKTKLKYGVAVLYEATQRPVIPIVLNTGFFWPRRSFLRYPGKVIYEYLPPIQPGLPVNVFLSHLTEVMEKGCRALDHETNQSLQGKKPFPWAFALSLAIGLASAGIYGVYKARCRLIEACSSIQSYAQNRGVIFNYGRMETHFQGAHYQISFDQPSLEINFFPWLRMEGKEKWVVRKNIFSFSPKIEAILPGPLTLRVGDSAQEILSMASAQGTWLPENITLTLKKVIRNEAQAESISYGTFLKGDKDNWAHDVSIFNLQLAQPNILIEKAHMAFYFQESSPTAWDLNTLNEWLRAGGLVEVEDLSLSIPPFKGSLKGALTADESRVLLGSFTLETEGTEKGLDIIHSTKLVPPWMTAVLKMVLKGFKKSDNDKHGLSLTLQNNHIYLEGVPIASLPF